MSDKIKYTTYIARPIENFNKKETKEIGEIIREELKFPDLLIYDPVFQEASKVGKTSEEQCEYIKNLKRAGKWTLFYNEMWKIWFGSISQNTDIVPLLNNLRMRKHIDGNRQEEMKYWGDAEAVVRSDFLTVFLPHDAKTVGTIYEIVFAFMFRIPIYLIVPDAPKTETNSSLLFGVMISKGEVFYSVKDYCKFIKEKYNLK